jgi:SHS2 domain-containing protein
VETTLIRGRPRYELLEHTADTGVVVRADSLERLFETAAAAMFDLIADLDRVEASGEGEETRVEAPDLEALLVAWLDELLGRALAAGRVYGEFDVTRVGRSETGAWEVSAVVRGAALDLESGAFRTEVKAVTWHALSVSRDARGLEARVIFDI